MAQKALLGELANIASRVNASTLRDDARVQSALLHVHRSGSARTLRWLEHTLSRHEQIRNPYGLPEELVRAYETAPPPLGEICVGFHVRQQPMFIEASSLTMHATIKARTGGGKTNFIRFLALQLAQQSQAGIWIVDRKRDLQNIAGPAGFSVVKASMIRENPWRPPSGVPAVFWMQVVVQAFGNAFFLLSGQNILYEIVNDLIRRNQPVNTPTVVEHIKRYKARSARDSDLISQLQHRLNSLRTAWPSADAHEPVDVDRAASARVIVEPDFALASISTFFVTLLLCRLIIRRLYKGQTDQLETCMIIDEAKQILDPVRERQADVYGAPILADLVSQARAFGIGLVAADQLVMPSYLTMNAGTRILLPCTPSNDRDDPLNVLSPEVRQWWIANGQPGQALISTADHPPTRFALIPYIELPQSDGGVAEPPAWLVGNHDRAPDLGEKQNVEEPAPREDNKQDENKPNKPQLEAEELRLALEVALHPYQSLTTLYARLVVTPARGKRMIEKLERLNRVRLIKLQLRRRGRPALVVEPTDELLDELHVQKPRGRGSAEHKAYQHLVAERFKQDGYTVHVEHDTGGHAVDVFAKNKAEQVAIEIELTADNLEHNLEALAREGFARILVLTKQERVPAIERRAAKVSLPPTVRVEVASILAYLPSHVAQADEDEP